jgi:hypothetical protein
MKRPLRKAAAFFYGEHCWELNVVNGIHYLKAKGY